MKRFPNAAQGLWEPGLTRSRLLCVKNEKPEQFSAPASCLGTSLCEHLFANGGRRRGQTAICETGSLQSLGPAAPTALASIL